MERRHLSRSEGIPWHLITPEYPPQPGGVSDYTCFVARALAAAGEEVYVWCPSGDRDPQQDAGVSVGTALGRMGLPDLWRLGAQLDRCKKPRKLLLQWVPHGFGFRSMNLPLCFWIWARSVSRRDEVEIMIHEPFLQFREGSLKQDLAALVHRVMIVTLLLSTRRVWVSTPQWIEQLKPYTLGRNVCFGWLPVPSNIPVIDDPRAICATRSAFDRGGVVFGHFGTFGRLIADLLREIVPRLLRALPDASIVLIGPGGQRFRTELVKQHPEIAERVFAAGYLSLAEVSIHLSAFDVMIQPFADGVTTRRTSVMAGLSHGKATITTFGRSSEPFWKETNAVALLSPGDTEGLVAVACKLSEDEVERRRLGGRAKDLYAERFDVRRTVEALRATSEVDIVSCAS